MWNAIPIMYEHGINVAIRKLVVLSDFNSIERELDKRFVNPYPQFDPAVHTHLDPKQFDLKEKARYARWRRRFTSAMREQNAVNIHRDWTEEGLTRRTIWDSDVNHNYNLDSSVLRMKSLNLRTAHEYQNNPSNDQDNNGYQSLKSTEQGKRGSNDGSRVGENPNKRRRNTVADAPQGDAAPQGDKENR